eukprot:TRINITY_DN25449_c0_g1_i1.p1 TRINITY_DN25449_c0_g1~~TRINITY_DN25449_c0_g1_i1.p1  ORF type:complete len:343 (+),score=85.18 TRINITY_DN25449_c0_g1_i1:75-1031(+)
MAAPAAPSDFTRRKMVKREVSRAGNCVISCLAIGSSGTKVVGMRGTDPADSLLQVWYDNSRRRDLLGHTGEVFAVAISEDAETLYVGSACSQYIMVWDASLNGPEGPLLRVPSKTPVSNMCFTPHAEEFVYVDSEGVHSISLGEEQQPDGGKALVSFPDCSNARKSLLCGSGQWLVSTKGRNAPEVMCGRCGEKMVDLQLPRSGKPHQRGKFYISQKGPLAAAESHHTALLWDIFTGKLVRILQCHTGAPVSIAFTQHHILVLSKGDNLLRRFGHRPSDTEIDFINVPAKNATCLAVCPCDKSLVVGYVDGTVAEYDI